MGVIWGGTSPGAHRATCSRCPGLGYGHSIRAHLALLIRAAALLAGGLRL